jgi:hypothetical protein
MATFGVEIPPTAGEAVLHLETIMDAASWMIAATGAIAATKEF